MKQRFASSVGMAIYGILEYLGGIETRKINWTQGIYNLILEYLGGIETMLYPQGQQVLPTILEYLGGIETGIT